MHVRLWKSADVQPDTIALLSSFSVMKFYSMNKVLQRKLQWSISLLYIVQHTISVRSASN